MNLPDFRDESLQSLSACAIFHAERSDLISLVADCGKEFESEFDSDGAKAWIRLVVEAFDDNHGHLHIDVGRRSVFDFSDRDKGDLHGIQERISRFNGQEVDVCVTGQFEVNVDDLPKRGLVSSLRRISTESCGAELRLTGAEMEIVNDDEFTGVKWSPGPDADTLTVEIDARATAVVGDDYLLNLVRLMHTGLECFILEAQKDSGEHAIPDRPAVPKGRKVGN